MKDKYHVSVEERRHLMARAQSDLARRAAVRGCFIGVLIGVILAIAWLALQGQ